MRRPASSFVDETEDLSEAIAQELCADLKAVRQAIGARPYKKAALTPDDKALLQVPLYRQFKADPAYWQDIAKNQTVTVQRNGVPTVLHGAAAVRHHNLEMRQLEARKLVQPLPMADSEGVPSA